MLNALLLLVITTRAQTVKPWTSADIYMGLKKLKVLGSVLYVAAHPDDENTRLITWLSKERLYRTGYLSMTRGDGGQNLIGDEQGVDLGLIRTQELLAARRIDGGEQFFTRAFDFGYSKNPEETFVKWDKEKILSDVVWVIRKFQPDIIITRFPTTGEGGHGHHTASAILANEAFEAAADPSRFPEQLKYAGPWAVKRVLWNTFNFGGNNTQREDQFKVEVGGYNALLGKSYGEIAAESRSQHKSQGFGVPAGRGEAFEYFKATKGDQPVNDLLEGVNTEWSRLTRGSEAAALIDNVTSTFDFIHPEKSVKGLVNLYNKLDELRMANTPVGDPADRYALNKIEQKQQEIKQLIEQCSGLFADATTTDPYAVQTDSVKISFVLNNRLGASISLNKIMVQGFDSSFNTVLQKNRNLSFTKSIPVSSFIPLTQPYWLKEEMAEGHFTVNDQQKIGQPDADPAYNVVFSYKIEDQFFSYTKPVRYKFTDPVKGELYQPLIVVPPVAVSVNPPVLMYSEKSKPGYSVKLRAAKNYAAKGDLLTVENPKQKGTVVPLLPNVPAMSKNEEREFEYSAGDSLVLGKNRFMITDAKGVVQSAAAIRSVKYDHIPDITYFDPAVIEVKNLQLKTYNKKIGYITGAGDKVPEALEQMGYEVTLLGNKELSKNNLQQFDAIITGVRAYNTNEWMSNYYDRLMKYVENGGNLIVQYNTNNFISNVKSKIAPFPFAITRTRVSDETAPVSILKPDHPVFNFPNKITTDDFAGWKQERSIYHAADFDKTKYEAVLSVNDPGEKPDDGSLIIGKHGKGYFTYTGLVFFRQLPAGVSGAYRLLANIIALNKKKGF